MGHCAGPEAEMRWSVSHPIICNSLNKCCFPLDCGGKTLEDTLPSQDLVVAPGESREWAASLASDSPTRNVELKEQPT